MSVAKEALLPRGAFSGVGSSAFGGRGPFAAAVLEAVAVAVHLQDVDVVGKPVQQCAGEPFGAKDFGPLFEGKIAGYQRRSAFIALAKGLEEQLGAGLGQRDEAQFIDDEKLIAGQQLLKTHQMLLVAGLDQFADQRRGSRKADTVAALTGRQAEGQRKVSLPGSTVAQQQHVLLAGQELASSQIQNQCFVGLWDGQEVEAVETLDDWELCLPDAALGGPAVAVN